MVKEHHNPYRATSWPLACLVALELSQNTRGSVIIREITPILRRRILALARQGKTTRQIAKRVHRGEATVAKVIAEELDYVERYRAAIYFDGAEGGVQ